MLPPDETTRTWRLPEIPSGGPEAAREVAATCDRLAALLRSTAVTLGQIRQLCTSTTGRSGAAIDHHLGLLQREHDITAGNFEHSAATMRRYADELEAAHRRHRFSLRNMLELGATAVVGAGVIWLTMGGATPAVTAAIGAEVAVTEAAAAAAATAGEGAAAECALLARAFAAVRGFVAARRSQLVYGEVWLTAQSLRSQVVDNRFLPSTSPQALAMDAASMAVGAGAGRLAEFALAGRLGTRMTVVGSAGASAVAGAVPQAAYDWERTGSFPATSFGWNAFQGAGSSVLSGSGKKLIKKIEKWKATHHPRPQPGRHRTARQPEAG